MDEKVYCFLIIYCRVIFFQLFLWLWIILILARWYVESFNVHFTPAKELDENDRPWYIQRSIIRPANLAQLTKANLN